MNLQVIILVIGITLGEEDFFGFSMQRATVSLALFHSQDVDLTISGANLKYWGNTRTHFIKPRVLPKARRRGGAPCYSYSV